MAWLNVILFVLLTLMGCGDEGGISGTGISGGSDTASSVVRGEAETIFEGTVSQVTKPLTTSALDRSFVTHLAAWLGPVATAHADHSVSGIRVQIERADAFTWTDENGDFRLDAPVKGPVTIVFDRDDGAEATLGTHVPFGSVLTLENVHVDFRNRAATAERRIVRFTGIVEETVCSEERITVSSESDPDPSPFTVLLTDTTPHDADGNDVSCNDLEPGETLWVKGDVQDDGYIVATTVETARRSGSFDAAGGTGSSPGGLFR